MQPTGAEMPSLFGKHSTTPWNSLCQAVILIVSRRDTHCVTPRHSLCHAATLALASLLLLLTPLVFTSCDDRNGLLPPSGGRLYEVLLVGDKDSIVKTTLQEDVPRLPQSEPQFDVSSISHDRFNQSVSMARNIVMVDINPQLYSSVRLRHEKDVWAKPQMVVHVNAPSVKVLKDSIQSIAPSLLQLLNRAELNKSIAMLKMSQNIKAEKLIKRMFGIDMLVPMDLVASHRGKDFLWLSNNSPTTMTNMVIYKDWAPYKSKRGLLYYHSEEPVRFVKARDYMLGKNIKGETDSMQMQTVDGTVGFTWSFRSERDRKHWLSHPDDSIQPIIIYRGLWEMTGDDMGGPFVSRRLPMKQPKAKGSYDCENIVIEGFVFAPGKKKRNAIRQLEAALYTAKAASKN